MKEIVGQEFFSWDLKAGFHQTLHGGMSLRKLQELLLLGIVVKRDGDFDHWLGSSKVRLKDLAMFVEAQKYVSVSSSGSSSSSSLNFRSNISAIVGIFNFGAGKGGNVFLVTS